MSDFWIEAQAGTDQMPGRWRSQHFNAANVDEAVNVAAAALPELVTAAIDLGPLLVDYVAIRFRIHGSAKRQDLNVAWEALKKDLKSLFPILPEEEGDPHGGRKTRRSQKGNAE